MNHRPTLFLNFNCGCRERLASLHEAICHSKKMKHTVTFTGCLSLNPNLKKYEPLTLNPLNNMILVNFSCGDGFHSSSYSKAEEHVKKTKHIVQVTGRIVCHLKPSHNWRGSGKKRPATLLVPTLVSAVPVAGEVKGRKIKRRVGEISC